MDEFLEYFRAALEHPDSVQHWSKWWAANCDRVEKAVDNADFELLRTGRLEAARMIVRRSALVWSSRVRIIPTFGTGTLSEDELAKYEQACAMRIPDDFRNFLLAYNGGNVQAGWFRLSAMPASENETAERMIVEFSRFTSIRGITCSTALDPSFDFPNLPGQWMPLARLNASGSLCASDYMLLISVKGDECGAVWFCPTNRKRIQPASLIRVSKSFTELMNSLDYPTRAKPWMEQIDRGDVEGFRQWLEVGGEFDNRDPASGVTPIEYVALVREPNLYLDQAWQNEEGKSRRIARVEIAKLLIEREAQPGRSLSYATSSRNIEIVRLLPLARIDTEELREAWDRLRDGPGADPGLLAEVEKELKKRKK